ncbi:hypothetical protein BDV3_001021 [Batrachochytrium dendrobatidis]
MSMGSSWQVFSKAIAPERGAFPMDLDGVCGAAVRDYISCVRSSSGETMKCRELARLYLSCRMDHGLMEKDDFANLGFNAPGSKKPTADQNSTASK